jgi:NADPH2:quinone reductase
MSFFSSVGRRVVLSEYGETPLEAVDSFTRIEEFLPPDPSTLSARDVAVSIRSASVNWVDLIMASGQYQHMVSPPYCPGLEYAGVVEWVGEAVDRFKVGDRVMVDGLTAGPRSSGDYQRYGGYASFAIAPQDSLFPVPEGFSFDEACNLLGSYETAYHCLVACGQLQAGETVLILGASGATGMAAVHLAKLLGANVIATGRSEAKLEVVKEQGADHVIHCKAEGDAPYRFRDEVKKLTGGKGVDLVYDGVGGTTSLEAMRCVKFGARFLIVGWAGTPFVAKGKGGRGAPNANMLPTNLIMMKGLKVLGCPTVISTEKEPSIRPQRLREIFGWAESGSIRPYVSQRFDLDDYKAAMHAKWSGKIIGGCVLNP